VTTRSSEGIVAASPETFAYRPSASPICATILGADGNLQPGKWYNKADKTCYNGFPQTVKMAMPAGPLTDNVVWSVQYNATTSGPSPIGSTSCNSGPGGCAYDALNVGSKTFAKAPFSGTDLVLDEAFLNGAMETGWALYRPLGAITTVK